MMAVAVRQRFTVVLRRVLYGQRGYSSQQVTGQSVWARLDASVERALPARVKLLWNHPAGIKTIFFWAPTFKWCLVIAGIADYTRPPEKLSARQSGALCATGAIWSRYSLVIIPKNWNLFSVNFFLCITGGSQLLRIYLHRKKLRKENPEEYKRLYGPPDGAPCPAGEGGRREVHTGEGGEHGQFKRGPGRRAFPRGPATQEPVEGVQPSGDEPITAPAEAVKE